MGNAFIDEAGKQHGRWAAIRRADNSEDGSAQWLCRCDCGAERIMSGAYLRRGRSKSCGCLRADQASAHMVGRKWGRLTVLSRAGSPPQKNVTWLCRCDCGNEVIVVGNYLRSGDTKSCGCLWRDTVCLPEGEAAFNSIVRNLKQSAKRRDLELALTDEQVRALITQPCYYCGAEPAQVGSAISRGWNGIFLYNGIDRQDSSRGYIIGNVVPCCTACNKAKSTMTTDQFRSWVVKVYEHFADGGNMGRAPGISGNVDLNIFVGGLQDLSNLGR